MNTQETQALVSSMKVLSKGTDAQKYEFAKVLYQASHLDWSETLYGSFAAMLNAELTNTASEVHGLIYAYQCMTKFNWSRNIQLQCLAHLGWTRYVMAIQAEHSPIDPHAFMEKYHKMPVYMISPKAAPLPDADRAYAFTIPAFAADKLDGILKDHGMTIAFGRRHGVRNSVISLIGSI
jgi:hypothetical protein